MINSIPSNSAPAVQESQKPQSKDQAAKPAPASPEVHQQVSAPPVQQSSPSQDQAMYQRALLDIKNGNITSAQSIMRALQGQDPSLALRLKAAFPTS